MPGLTPLLLTEFDVPAEIVPADAFLKVLSGLGGAVPELPALPDNAALLLGQYLSALNILSAKEEEDLHVRMMRGAVDRGHRSIVFKPHPTAPASYSRALETEAAKLGVELTVLNTPVLAEVLFEKARPALVVGCFSTALFTASVFYDLPVARIGTEPILDRLTPYQNSNRVPVALADALLPDLEGKKDNDALPTDELNGLVVALGFTMQPQIHLGCARPRNAICPSTSARAPSATSSAAGSPRSDFPAASRSGWRSCPATPRHAGWCGRRARCARRYAAERGRLRAVRGGRVDHWLIHPPTACCPLARTRSSGPLKWVKGDYADNSWTRLVHPSLTKAP